MGSLSLAVVVVSLLLLPVCWGWSSTTLGSFAMPDAGFLTILPSVDSSSYDLFITQFTSGDENGVFTVRNVDMNNFGSSVPQLLANTDSIPWPNEVSDAEDIFPTPGIFVPNGFLVPGMMTGGVWWVNNTGTTAASITEMTKEKTDFFYHRAEPIDLVSDGEKGILTCRAKQSTLLGTDAAMVYLVNDGTKWVEHILDSGMESCDTFFRLYDLDNDGFLEIIAGVFFGKILKIYWADNGQYLNSSAVHSRTIDTGICPFDMALYDMNNDGRLDLLMSDSEENKPGGNVFIYEIPDEFRTAEWTRHKIASGFDDGSLIPGRMAPGPARVVQNGSNKPLIALPGDDGGNLYILSANSNDPTNWAYTTNTVAELSGTVAGIDVYDINGDGNDEVFVAAYSSGVVWLYTINV